MTQDLTGETLEQLAERINQNHKKATEAARTTLVAARDAGEALIAAKTRMSHGEFLSWCERNCDVGKTQGWRYMRVARNWHLLPTDRELSIKEAIALLSSPTGTSKSSPGELLLPNKKRKQHLFNTALPEITGDEWDDFLDSIRRRGLEFSGSLYHGECLDGWQRYRACKALGIDMRWEEIGVYLDRFLEMSDDDYMTQMNLTRDTQVLLLDVLRKNALRQEPSAGLAYFTKNRQLMRDQRLWKQTLAYLQQQSGANAFEGKKLYFEVTFEENEAGELVEHLS